MEAPGEHAAQLPVSLAPRPALLAGREELLAGLDDRLTAGSAAGPQVVALYGLGGAGKTSVAVEYAYRHLAEVGLAWQFPAEDPALLLAEFSRLAAQLGARRVVDARDPVASVHAVLAAFAARWLLVFDNADGQKAVQSFLPPAGRGWVLITSQSAVWMRGQAVEVPALGTGVAAAFLVSRTGDPDEAAATDLVGELGGLPLALEQAAAYIQATGITLATYLSLFRDRRADLLARGEATGHPANVAATLGLALSRLRDEAPAAIGLLRLLACLAPEPVPLALLLSDIRIAGELAPDVAATLGLLLGDPVTVGDAVAALRRYSLLTPAGNGLVLVHRLVQAITLAELPASMTGQWERAAAALVQAAIPADPELPAAWPVCALLLPHARVVLGLTASGMSRVARYLGRSGSYPAARDLFQLIAHAYTEDGAYGAEHPDTLTARAHLARWTGEAGDPAGARDQLAALLPVRERVLGAEHPDTLAARDNLARWTDEAGDAARARDQYAALLPVLEQVLGPEHPDALTARRDVASWTGEAGDPAAARDQYAALLPVFVRVLGPEHPDTLIVRRQLASRTGEAGDPAAARDQYAALLPVLNRMLGPDHPETLMGRANLAAWTADAGDAAAGRDLLAELLPVRERVLGPDHPDTLDSRHELAYWTGEAGDPPAARDQFAALLPVRQRVSGPEHPETLAVRHSLAYWTGKAGNPAAARDQLAALLPVRERVLGPEHPNTLMTHSELAGWTGEAGNPGAARDQLAALLPVRERVLGPDHPDALNSRHALAYWTGRAGNPAAARDLFAALLPVFVRVLGPDHPSTLATHDEIARWTGEAGDAGGARDRYAALLPVFERVQGAEHPDTWPSGTASPTGPLRPEC